MAVVGHQEGQNTTATSPSPKSRADIFAPSAYASSPLRSDSSIDKFISLFFYVVRHFLLSLLINFYYDILHLYQSTTTLLTLSST